MNTDTAISVSGVTYVYPGTRALDNVSFEITRGSVTALVGPNGAGKTTLLRCLAGLDRPLTGSIHVAGIDVLEEPRLAHAGMGYLSDFFGLYDTLTVRQCLAHAAAANGVGESSLRETVERTAARLDIADRLEQRCAALSRGLRQRVAIGQAIVHAPAVLLLDEPASGLDPEARHALAGLFTRLRDEGMTMVVSSHILAELDEYSTHMLVLRGGKILEHRPLGGNAGAATQERHVRVRLAGAHAGWRDLLAATAGVRVVEASDSDALIAVHAGVSADAAGEQARVLRELVAAGVPVASFAEETENLHQSYLRTVDPQARPQ
ncbi:MAG: ABC transporter ATP-binding protein, partial [Burkholderiales bacterium]